MDEVDLILRNELPFGKLSSLFPGITFFRWCNSAMDYLEFYGNADELDSIVSYLPEIEKELGTHVIYRSKKEKRLSVMLVCRCSRTNSTIRIAELDNCIWKAPVKYAAGEEKLTIITLLDDYLKTLFADLDRIGTVEIVRKMTVYPESLRDMYTISLQSIFNGITRKQLEIMRSALQHGYFSIPRKISLEKLARINNLSKSTIEEHLNKARTRVISTMEPYISLYLESLGSSLGSGEQP